MNNKLVGDFEGTVVGTGGGGFAAITRRNRDIYGHSLSSAQFDALRLKDLRDLAYLVSCAIHELEGGDP